MHQIEQKAQMQRVATEFREEFSGPIPHPAILEHYNQIIPGSADRILVMAEQQSAHRRSLERQVIESDVKKSERGQFFAFIIALGGLILAGWLAMNGQELAGSIIGSIDIASLAGLFVYGRYQKGKEREHARTQVRSE